MKFATIIPLLFLLTQTSFSQDFITQWEFPEPTTQIHFKALTTDTVNYTWSASPSGNSGNGSFIQTSPDAVILSDLNIIAGDTVILQMAPENLSRFYINFGPDRNRLIEVTQWGNVDWTSMTKTFHGCQNIIVSANDNPDLTGVTQMDGMFQNASSFNQNIENWNVSNVINMSNMFSGASDFNQTLDNWDVSNVTNMSGMFSYALDFNQNIGNWDVSKVVDMSGMFRGANIFDQDINGWEVSSVTDMSGLFYQTDSFNQPIGSWDVSNVIDMSSMFSLAQSFNQDISEWDVSKVTSMSDMFDNAYSFNQDIGDWDVSNVTDMEDMFTGVIDFNHDIGNWDVSNVTDMSGMFFEANSFNQPIGSWNVSNAVNMHGMFSSADSFNQPLNSWDVTNVTDMWVMFYGASSFNQLLGSWKLNSAVDMESIFDNSGMDCNHYSATLVGWQENNTATTDVILGASSMKYGTSAVAARNALINEQGWTIFGDEASGMACDKLIEVKSDSFITQWTFPDTTTQIQFSTLTTDTVHYTWSAIPSGNNGNGSFIQTAPDAVILSGLNIIAGDTVILKMAPDNLSRFYFDQGQDYGRLRDIARWGEVHWTSMSKAFYSCYRLNIIASDTPDFSNVTEMDSMFCNATYFNDDISHWDVSNITNMKSMFENALSFNQSIGVWDVSNVTDMSGMFFRLECLPGVTYESFNRDLSGWDVSSVTDMSAMFASQAGLNCSPGHFNQDISNWDVSNVTDISGMFFNNQSFNQDLSNWDVSNVTNMAAVFTSASSFNQDISDWDVSNVTNMLGMFGGAYDFNQDIGPWKLHPRINMELMLDGAGLDCDHYSSTLVGWHENNATITDVTVGVSGLEYGTSAVAARDSLISMQGWIILGDNASGMPCDELVSTDLAFGQSEIMVYPNPTSGILTLESEQIEPKSIRVYNSVGQEVTDQLIVQKESNSMAIIDLSTLSAGIYFLRTSNSSEVLYKE